MFHTLKNGCRIEQLQLDSFDKLQRAIVLYLVVSCRIGYLMRLSRDEHACERPASEFFCPLECRLAYALYRKKPPVRPKLKEVVRLIAMLGGFIGRKGDGEPGSTRCGKACTTCGALSRRPKSSARQGVWTENPSQAIDQKREKTCV